MAFTLLANTSGLHEDTVFRTTFHNGIMYVGTGWSQGGSDLASRVYAVHPQTGVMTLSYDAGEQSIRSLVSYNGSLYAGTGVGGKVFVFDGTNWGEATTLTVGGSVICGCVHAGNLYMGETVTGKVYRFNGTSWTTAVDLADDHIESLCSDGTSLWIGTGNAASAYKVYEFDGGSETLRYTASSADKSECLSISYLDGFLYFGEYDPVAGAKIVKYRVSDGDTSVLTPGSVCDALYCSTAHNGALYFGAHPSPYVFTYNGTTLSLYQTLGSGQSVRDLDSHNGSLYAALRASGTPHTGAAVYVDRASPPSASLYLATLDLNDGVTYTLLDGADPGERVKTFDEHRGYDGTVQTFNTSEASLVQMTFPLLVKATSLSSLHDAVDAINDLIDAGDQTLTFDDGGGPVTYSCVASPRVHFVPDRAAVNGHWTKIQLILNRTP